MTKRKLIVATAQGWFDDAMNPANSMSKRLSSMENALNHTENALFAAEQALSDSKAEQAKMQLQLEEWKENHECNLDFRDQLKDENAEQRRNIESLQASLAAEREKSEAALALGQENCDAIYADLQNKLSNTKIRLKKHKALRPALESCLVILESINTHERISATICKTPINQGVVAAIKTAMEALGEGGGRSENRTDKANRTGNI